jgi:hypothetical protein
MVTNMNAEDLIRHGGVWEGDSSTLMFELPPESVHLSIWSPPYHVGKSYEDGQSFEQWIDLLRSVIAGHQHALIPGGFCAVNIADILCFADESMPRIQAETISKNRISLTREDVLLAIEQTGSTNRNVLAAHLGVSEQTVDRRLKGNNIRGGKYATQTRVKTVAGIVEDLGLEAGLYLYDRRVWVKDPAWANSRWHTTSLRAIDEFEYVFVLWKPGITRVDRERLTKQEWRDWGSRGVWEFPSVRSNRDHEAKFPIELPRRLIKLLSDEGNVVLDPFAGSGTTLRAAVDANRIPIGFELMEAYAEMSRDALHGSNRN